MSSETSTEKPPKPLGKLYTWLRVFFIMYIIAEMFIGAGSALILATSSVMFGPNEAFSLGDLITALGGLFLVISFIVSTILFCVFSYRATRNLSIIGAKGMDYTPGWAVGWYFIPFANLFKPYGAMKDMWRGTHYPDDVFADTPKLMPLWWLCWIVTNIVSNISFRLGREAGMFENYASNVELYKMTIGLDIVSAITGIISALLVLKFFKSIAIKQDQMLHARHF